MERDGIEIRLLTIRQRYWDALRFFSHEKVIPLEKFLYLKIRYQACNSMLLEYRNLKQKRTLNGTANQAS